MREHYATRKKLYLTGKWGEERTITPGICQKALIVFVMIYLFLRLNDVYRMFMTLSLMQICMLKILNY